ncbi:MAG: hypothetical protein HS117_16275 [Verrucomicrobiaceae bacterium]|nr:hypothetical protein [Verrucomicrobiaceae bacterium]
MKSARCLNVLVAWALCDMGSLAADEYPFPAVEDVAERSLIGVDENGHPRIADDNKKLVARLAAASDTPENLRFYAIWGLAISGYSVDSAEGLIQAAEDHDLSATARGYAAMGLRNFSRDLPPESKGVLRERLRRIVASESESIPDSIIRTLIAWGDAEWIANRLGDQIQGHQMEIEILSALEPPRATDRLLEIYRADERQSVRESYNRRAEIGRALLAFHDRRGIDILESLLDAEVVPLSGEQPNHQYRHNVFNAITRAVGQDFGYEHMNFDPSIDEAIRRFRSWWLESRFTFTFPEDDHPTENNNANKSRLDNPPPRRDSEVEPR